VEELTRTLPAWTYTSPEFYAAERERIFRQSWLVLGHVSQVAEAGDYVSMVVAGEPLMAIRGDDGELRAFSNVCRHRASRVVDGAGNCGKALRCPYHGWTYGLDGRLLAVPEKTGFPGFDRSANGLWELHCEVAAGFVFVSMADEPEPLDQYLGDAFFDRLAPYRPERLVLTQSGHERLEYNWKVSIDNYLEGYHIPVGHPSLLRLLDYRNYLVETTDTKVSVARSPIRDKASKVWRERLYQSTVRPMPGLPEDASESWSYIFAFPGMTWNLYPDQIDIWSNYPIDHRSTATHWQALRAPENSSFRDRAARRLNVRLNQLVQDEDVELCLRVQDGLGSHLYQAGVIGARENGLKHFHDLIRAAIPAAEIDHQPEGLSALRDLEAAMR
jgi:phenylpropionate dioxygenase-like ring-hydroxylating dioxygenase large terminal subunit